jgi:hypothetical protein
MSEETVAAGFPGPQRLEELTGSPGTVKSLEEVVGSPVTLVMESLRAVAAGFPGPQSDKVVDDE